MCSFFFFKQKTAYEMRISDWSSDVCSSDLPSGTTNSGLEYGFPRVFPGIRPGPFCSSRQKMRRCLPVDTEPAPWGCLDFEGFPNAWHSPVLYQLLLF